MIDASGAPTREEEACLDATQTQACATLASSAQGTMYSLFAGAFGNRGVKREMQDVYVMCPNLWDSLTVGAGEKRPSIISTCRASFFAVMDGHGGSTCASMCQQRLPQILAEQCLGCQEPSEARQALSTAVKMMDEEYIKWAKKQTSLSGTDSSLVGDGCTLVCCLLWKDVALFGWLGDSKACLGRVPESSDGEESCKNKPPKCHVLSKDHTLTNVKERQRIEKSGGFIEDGRVCGIMEVTRSLGDASLKSKGVSNQIDTVRVPLTTRDRVILLACDGLWRVWTPSDAVQSIWQSQSFSDAAQKLRMESSDHQVGKQLEAHVASKSIVREAIRDRQALDNVTALVIYVSADLNVSTLHSAGNCDSGPKKSKASH